MGHDRVEKAAKGIEAGVVSLSERLNGQNKATDIDQELRLLEALLFAAVEPIDTETLRERMPEDCDVGACSHVWRGITKGAALILLEWRDGGAFKRPPIWKPISSI